MAETRTHSGFLIRVLTCLFPLFYDGSVIDRLTEIQAGAGAAEGEGGAGIRPVAPLPRRARSVPSEPPTPAAQSQGTTTPQARPRRKWAPPPPPGPTLRQKVEASERARGARCDAAGCVFAPSDERPEGGMGGEMMGREGCGHVFHAGCGGEGRCVVCVEGSGNGEREREDPESVREGKRKRTEV